MHNKRQYPEENQLKLSTIGAPNEEIDRLRESLNRTTFENPNIRPLAGLPLMTHAFFPGGNGLYQGIQATRTPTDGTLILGSNFGCYNGFVNDQGHLLVLDERNNRTWTPLLDILGSAGIDFNECFFTNAWPFLHHGDGNLGPVGDWLNDQALMTSCLQFFAETIRRMKPRLIVALGTGPAAFLSDVWPEILSPWRGYSIPDLDDLPMAAVNHGNRTIICAAITHPSMPNAWRRRPPYQHRSGEITLLADARLMSENVRGSRPS